MDLEIDSEIDLEIALPGRWFFADQRQKTQPTTLLLPCVIRRAAR
jgi:hypothetical protein